MRCGICGHDEGHAVYEGREMMYGTREPFQYFQCSSCECLQIAKIPSDMSPYYDTAYYSLRDDMSIHFRNPVANVAKRLRCRYAITGRGVAGRWFYRRNPNIQLRSLSHAGVARDSRVLDVGSGSGHLLLELHNGGYRHVLGIDPYLERDIAYPNGVRVLKRSIHEMNLEAEGSWDVIMFHHAFEHIADQLPTLRACAGLLAPGGACLVRVPTSSSYAWEHYRTNWIQLDPPRHFYIHSIRSMDLLVTEAGLRIDRVVDDSFAIQFWGSEQFALDIPTVSEQSYMMNREASIFTAAQIAEYQRRAEELNRQRRGDQVAFLLHAA